MKSFKIITTLLVLLFTFSCQNDDDNSKNNNEPNNNPEVFTKNFGNEITRNFLGTVIDQNGNPIENVTISIGSKIAQTDENGVFIIRDANIYERFGYVKAEKTGYIHGSRSVVPTSGTNKVTIMLLEEAVVGTTNSGTAETITLPNGASVALEGSYIKADGSAYSGAVNVIMHHLNPTDENMANQMPGMLYAANANNEERMLQTFGMLAVELRGSGGEDLNLSTGSTAEIKMPLDASLLAIAPATIPLWYFDEEAGYWKEEGSATLVGDSYIGSVSHFSFWNCDVPTEFVNLCINITDENGNQLSNLTVYITRPLFGSRVGGITNEAGQVCGAVPKDETLEINFLVRFEGICSNSTTVYSSSIGPFATDSSINIIIDDNSTDLITETITGSFTDCDGNLITEGYVMLFNDLNNQLIDISYVDNGTFEFSTLRCIEDSNIFRLKAEDYTNTQETDIINFTYTSPLTNIGTIAACNSIDEFFTHQVDNNEPITQIISINANLQYDDTDLRVSYTSGSTGHYFNIRISDYQNPLSSGSIYNTSDSNPNTFVSISFEDDNYTVPTSSMQATSINISSIGNVGEYIDINIIGSFIDSNSVEHTIIGTVHVLRDN